MARPDVIDATSLTLRFKNGKHTVLLFADALTPFPAILTELLATLRERYPEGLPTPLSHKPTPIPHVISDVTLGVPKDVYDLSKGWDELDLGKARMDESPKSLGLKDGAQIAFAFGINDSQPGFHVEFSNVEELYPDEE